MLIFNLYNNKIVTNRYISNDNWWEEIKGGTGMHGWVPNIRTRACIAKTQPRVPTNNCFYCIQFVDAV